MKIVKVRLSDKMIADLKAHAEAEGTTVSAAIRELLAKALDNQSLREAQAELASIVDTAMRPHVERLAALSAKAAVAAGTAEWLSRAIAATIPSLDYRSAHVEARKKAVANLRMRNREEDEEE